MAHPGYAPTATNRACATTVQRPKKLKVAYTYHAGALWAGSFTIIHACSALRCSGPTFAYACTLHNSAWMMVLAFIHARAV